MTPHWSKTLVGKIVPDVDDSDAQMPEVTYTFKPDGAPKAPAPGTPVIPLAEAGRFARTLWSNGHSLQVIVRRLRHACPSEVFDVRRVRTLLLQNPRISRTRKRRAAGAGL
jgi:hypothetical protein